jgi:hypothetical protein
MAIINKTGITNGGTIQAEHITRVIDALSGVSTDTLILSGSMTGSLIGTLTGTASFATSASRAVSSSFAISSSRAVSSSFAATASYALNVGTSGEYMTLRLTTERTDTTTSTYYTGVGTFSNGVNRTGIMVPYDCLLVSASVYTNAAAGGASSTTSTLTPILYYNIETTPAVAVSLNDLDLEQFFDGNSSLINKNAIANSWLSLEVIENYSSTCAYTITCDVLIKKT